MTQEQKDLLLKDLCSRVTHGVLLSFYKCNNIHTLQCITKSGITVINNIDTNVVTTTNVENIKPYLFPLSSMTEEQWNNAPTVNLTDFTFEALKCGCFTIASYSCENELNNLIEFINWLIENHFDIYGLIPLGLAIDATFLNIY